MRICRFNENRLGLVIEGEVADVTGVLDSLPAHKYPFPQHDSLIANFSSLRPHLQDIVHAAPRVPLSTVKFLSPVANPGKIVAAPVNYSDHLKEARDDPNLNHAMQINEIQKAGLFLKATSSLIGAGENVQIRMPQRRTDHEVELAVVIGREATRVKREDALKHVFGYAISLDITLRGSEERSLRKSPDTHTVLGPWIVTEDELTDPSELDFWLKVNGEIRQESNTRDLILDVPALIEFASSFYTLHPGDIIITGTPSGVGPIKAGDVMHSYIQSIGEMSVNVL